MFPKMLIHEQKRASSLCAEREPCCSPKTRRNAKHRWWHNASGCLGSGTLLVLLPKCPLCLAGYLALWTGTGVAISIAARLRPMLEVVFFASAVLLLVRCIAVRIRQ
jgi:hypothetical protein